MLLRPFPITDAGQPEKQSPNLLPTGLSEVDRVIQGFPRGAIAEIIGPDTSGRTTLLHSLLASATSNMEVCAYVDTSNAFDPLSAAKTGVKLQQIIWIRCGNNIGNALKALDYLLHAGGFGIIAFDCGNVPLNVCRRLQMSYWYRFRRAIEKTPTILVLLNRESMAASCASLRLEMKQTRAVWSGQPNFTLLKEVDIEARSQKPVRPDSANFKARAID